MKLERKKHLEAAEKSLEAQNKVATEEEGRWPMRLSKASSLQKSSMTSLQTDESKQDQAKPKQ
jgi:hypothetical protein